MEKVYLIVRRQHKLCKHNADLSLPSAEDKFVKDTLT
jgi:hypothetical protein